MDLTITRLSGETFILSELGIKTLDFNVLPPRPNHRFEGYEDKDGFQDYGTTFEGRNMTAKLYLKTDDSYDLVLRRNEVFRMFKSKEAFYIVDSREPGKRWLVKAGEYTPDQLTDIQVMYDIPLISPSAYAESVGKTTDPFTFDSNKWQIGQGLTDGNLVYTFTTATFSVVNIGDIAIDPRERPLKITFFGDSVNLSIKNNTTGDEWIYTGTTTAQTIKLDGVKSTKSNVSIVKNTNKKIITIAPGTNEFTLTGASGSFSIAFDFRFYYL